KQQAMPKALWLSAQGLAAELREVTEAELAGTSDQAGAGSDSDTRVRIRVEYSDINYKDALAVTGSPGVVRNYPIVPGIDVVGVVENDPSGTFNPGDRVIGVGGCLGQTMHGGFAELALVDAPLLTKVPERFDNLTAAAIGTAGFTAALCVNRLLVHGIEPESEVWVTGST